MFSRPYHFPHYTQSLHTTQDQVVVVLHPQHLAHSVLVPLQRGRALAALDVPDAQQLVLPARKDLP